MDWLKEWVEDTSGECWRVCPACEAPLAWTTRLKATREGNRFVNIRAVEEPSCSSRAHRIFGWWLIRNREGLIVGRASMDDGRRLRLRNSRGEVVMTPGLVRMLINDKWVKVPCDPPILRSASYERRSKLYSRPKRWALLRRPASLLGDPTPWCARWRRQLEAEKRGNKRTPKLVLHGEQGTLPF